MPFTESDEIRRRREAAEALRYSEGQEVADARNRAQTLRQGIENAAYTQRMDQLIQDYQNRPAFNYDVNADALYRQYAGKYAATGRQAMADTVGKAAAMTGGYGNSYGASAGAQAYNTYLTQLNDIVPDLANMAYQRYQDEGSRMQDLYNMYGARQSLDYGMYRDALGDYQTERQWDRSTFDAERETALNRADLAYNRALAEYQQGVSEDQFNRNLQLQYTQLGEESRQFDAKLETGYGGGTQYLKTLGNTGSGTGTGTGSGSGAGNGQEKKDKTVAGLLWGSGNGDGEEEKTGAKTGGAASKFMASVMNKSEWAKRGSPKGSYQAYLSSVANAWYNEKRISEAELKEIAAEIKNK